MRKMCCALCAVLLAVTLTSCGQLESKSDMQKELLSLFPEAVITDIRENVSESGLASVEYTVKNHDVTFTVVNTQYHESMFNTIEAGVYNDYEAKLVAFFETEITNICEKYNVTSGIETKSLTINCDIKKLSDADKGLRAMQELLSLLEPYLPTEVINKKDCSFDFSVTLFSTAAEGKRYSVSCAQKNEFNYEDERKCLRFNIVDSVKAGNCNVACTQDDLDRYPAKEITALTINGIPFTSGRYPIEFTYDILSEEYQATVCYGTHLAYNGGVDDYLQREIIQSIYPQADYVIQEKAKETTYQIGKDRYRIKKTGTSEQVSFEFYKNGARLNIETQTQLNRLDTPGAAYYGFISIEDFADLMGMKVDSVDKNCIRLSVK